MRPAVHVLSTVSCSLCFQKTCACLVRNTTPRRLGQIHDARQGVRCLQSTAVYSAMYRYGVDVVECRHRRIPLSHRPQSSKHEEVRWSINSGFSYMRDWQSVSGESENGGCRSKREFSTTFFVDNVGRNPDGTGVHRNTRELHR